MFLNTPGRMSPSCSGSSNWFSFLFFLGFFLFLSFHSFSHTNTHTHSHMNTYTHTWIEHICSARKIDIGQRSKRKKRAQIFFISTVPSTLIVMDRCIEWLLKETSYTSLCWSFIDNFKTLYWQLISLSMILFMFMVPKNNAKNIEQDQEILANINKH